MRASTRKSIIVFCATFLGLQVIFHSWSTKRVYFQTKYDKESLVPTVQIERTTNSIERSEMMKEKVKRWCSALNISSPVTELQQNNILVDDERKVLYCSVPKVASTNWKRIWLQLIGGQIESNTNKSLRDRVHDNPYLVSLFHPVYHYDRWNILATYRKFLIVRQPLERVISTYRDKLEFLTGEETFDFRPYFKNKVLKRFGNILGLDNTTGTVSFPDFVRFITSHDDEQIVLDPHWLSIHQTCNPCAINYDFIGKFEHLEEDSKSILKWLEADHLITSFPPPVRSVNTTHYVRHYLDQLSHPLRLSFLNKYILDYLTFDYAFLN